MSSRGHPSQTRRYRAPVTLVNSSARSSQRCVFAPDQLSVGSSRVHPSQMQNGIEPSPWSTLATGQVRAVSLHPINSSVRFPQGHIPHFILQFQSRDISLCNSCTITLAVCPCIKSDCLWVTPCNVPTVSFIFLILLLFHRKPCRL